MTVPDYGISTCDENIPDYGLDDLFDEERIQQEINKQLVPKPPTYEETLADKFKEGRQISVDPQYIPPEPEYLPPEYDEDEVKSLTMLWMQKTELM